MTICSYDNSGQLKFDVDIEMEQGYWNTSSSRLWTRIRDLMHDELVAKYNNMRQNGLSYESLMECFYDEQIAKIPQKYYNMDYDVKYAPFADSYIGMANGDTYEHLKRWIQQRLRFVDTLYDYAPSYNNDVLTIRANTTEPMTLEIETYTPVYQHLSWYNNQMDKKKIDGKTSVTFTGKAMAETDQEVLIYGGSNIKSIKGITSMNPNRMLIGSATKLIELDAPNCPLLADINANKANLAPHTYLNKVNLSGCPLLGGNLIINQSPLIREIDIRGTAITGLNLSSNLRNLEILRLPSAITSIVLNDASQLHTLGFDEGGVIQNVTMTNCNALTNVTNFNLEDATSVTLNNSYNTTSELYFSKAVNLSVSNMPNLERIIYTPNAEHEVFDKANVDNASNYTVSTFNCPKLNTFMTTAPYRISYGKDYGEKKPNEVFEANVFDISSTQFKDVKLLCTTDTNVLKLPQTVENLIVDSAYDLDTEYLTDGDYDTIHTDLYEPYNTNYESNAVGGDNVTKLITWHTGNFNTIYPSISWGDKYSDKIYVMEGTDYTVQLASSSEVLGTWFKVFGFDSSDTVIWQYGGASTNDTTACAGIIPSGVVYIRFSCIGGSDNITITYTTPSISNIVPSASDGSLIFSMYAPHNTTEPASGVWDLKGLELEEYHTFGLNNDVKLVDDTLTMPDRYNEYSLSTKNKTVKNEIARYTASDWNTFPTFNSEFTYTYDVIRLDDGVYEYSIVADSMDNLPTQISFNGKSNLLTVEYLNIDNVTNMNFMFYNCTNLTSLDVGGWDVGDVTNMSYMFDGCKKLTSLDVGGWDVGNVTDIHHMFANCNNLTSLDLNKWDTTELTDMSSMFRNCSKLTSLDLSNWDISKIASTDCMFDGCTNLTSLDVSKWDTTKVTYMGHTFRNCNKLTSLDLSNWDTSNVTSMNSMFQYCMSLTSLDLSNFDTSNVTDMGYMFYGCNNLISLDLSNFDTKNVTNMDSMFNNCKVLTSLDLSNFDTSKVTNMSAMFSNCTNLISLDLSNFDTSKVTNMSYMFETCSKLTSLNVSNFDTSKVTNMNYMFFYCNNLTSLDLSSFDTSKVASMSSIFTNCASLQELHIESWPLNDTTQEAVSTLPVGNDAKNILYTTVYFTAPSGWTQDNAYEIIRYTANASGVKPDLKNFTAYSLSEIDNGDGTYTVRISANSLDNLPTSISFYNRTNLLTVEKMNTSKLTDMSSMFQICNNLTYVNTSNWDTSNVTSMSHMFSSCTNLTSLDVSSWTTSKVTDMTQMFNGCKSLETIDLSDHDCSMVTETGSMFDECTNIKTIDLTNTNMPINYMATMFANCSNLEEIKCDGWINESKRNYTMGRWDVEGITNKANKLKTDIYMYLCRIYKMPAYLNTDATEPRMIDFSGVDTSNLTSMEPYGNTTSITNLHSENGLDMSLRFAKSLTHIDSLHFKYSQLGFMYYGCPSSTLDIIFETTENSTNYKYENWTPGFKDNVLGLSDSKFTVASIVSFLECLYDYVAKGETTDATLKLGNNLNRLTPEQIAIATNKGWTLT